MKKYIYILVLLIAATTYSCKKEATLAEPAKFARVKFNDDAFGVFNNPDGSSALSITYQGQPIAKNTDGSLTVLAGEGEFSFFKNNTKVLTRKLNMSKDTAKTYVFFKPDPDAERVELLNNNQLLEPRPAAEDRIKVKIANFGQSILGNKNLKAVFSQNGIPVDTIQTVGSDFTNVYSEMSREIKIIRNVKRPTTGYSLTFLDENNNPVLDTNGAPVVVDFASSNQVAVNLYTIIISVSGTQTPNPSLITSILFAD